MFNGDFRSYYENGQIAAEGNFKDGKPWNGIMKFYREDGTVKLEQNYKEGLLLDQRRFSYEWCLRRCITMMVNWQHESPYKDGKRHGISKTYKQDGKIVELGWNQGEMTGYAKFL